MDFLQFLLGFFNAGDIGESDARLRVGKSARAAFSERHRLTRAALTWRIMKMKKPPMNNIGKSKPIMLPN